MTEPRYFPVLHNYGWEEQKALGCPRVVPWAFIADHEEWCLINHSQSAQRLAERGGLDPREMWLVVNHKRYREYNTLTVAEAVAWLKAQGFNMIRLPQGNTPPNKTAQLWAEAEIKIGEATPIEKYVVPTYGRSLIVTSLACGCLLAWNVNNPNRGIAPPTECPRHGEPAQ